MVVLGPGFQSLSACSFPGTGVNSAAKYYLTPTIEERMGVLAQRILDIFLETCSA